MTHSTREANVAALVHMVARHKLYEPDGLHELTAEGRGAHTAMSVTCSCGKNWFLLDADVEARHRQLIEWGRNDYLVRFLNRAVGLVRSFMIRVAPHKLDKARLTRFDRDPPV